jgi:pimeloyl-ACP methyl ester carboxylesterase
MVMSQEIEIQLPHLKIAAKRWGAENGVPLLALHGWLDNAASFDHIAPLLSGFNLIAVDLPGHGRSEHRPAGEHYFILDYVADILSIANALGWDKFSLLGHSMGGSLATLVAGATPARVNRLALLESLGPYVKSVDDIPENLAGAIERRENTHRRRLPVYQNIPQMVKMRKSVGTITENSVKTLLSRNVQKIEGGFTWSSDYRLTLPSMLYLTEDIVCTFLRRIMAPVLLVQAEGGILGKGAFMGQTCCLEQRLKSISNLKHHLIAGDHHLHLDDPQPVATLLQDFL